MNTGSGGKGTLMRYIEMCLSTGYGNPISTNLLVLLSVEFNCKYGLQDSNCILYTDSSNDAEVAKLALSRFKNDFENVFFKVLVLMKSGGEKMEFELVEIVKRSNGFRGGAIGDRIDNAVARFLLMR